MTERGARPPTHPASRPRPRAADGEREGARFIGRVPELAELRAGLAAARAGNGAFYLVAGEPGIGKTRLTTEFARRAAGQGARVVRGGCVEESGAPPYWPWIQVLRGNLGEGPSELMRRAAALVSALAPNAERVAAAAPVAPDADAARFGVFDALATVLRDLAATTPTVVVLDDLQWADESSLLFLQFLARSLAGTHLLVVAAYRDVEARLSPEVGRRIAALACDARTIRLTGLGDGEVALLIERITRHPAADGLARELHRRTGGNPLFVDEVLRTLAAAGRLEQSRGVEALPLPERIRASIRRRMELVSTGCRRVLEVAATLGRDCDLTVLDRVCMPRGDRPLDVVDEARAAGMLTVAEGRLAFTHDVFREVLYDDLAERARAALHAAVGVALEGLYAGDLDRHCPELAHHFFRAGLAEARKAMAYAVRAGERAARGFAFAEAVRHYQRALERLPASGAADVSERCRILLALGESLWSTGEFDEAKRVYAEAAELAETAHLTEELARAALGFGGQYVGFGAGLFDRRLADLLEQGLAAAGEAESTLRASLMARLGAALAYSPERDRGAALARSAVALARRLGDETTLHFVLSCCVFATWSPDNLEERLATGREIVRLGASEGAGAVTFHGLLASVSHIESGDVAAADRETEAYRHHTKATGQRISAWFLGVHRVSKAFLEGRFAEVEALAVEALRLGHEAQNPGAGQLFGVQLLALRREQGRLAEIADGVRALADEHPAVPAWRAACAMVHAEIGREADARRALEVLGARDFADVPRDMFWLITMWLLTETVARLGDGRRAATLYELFRPFGGRLVHTGAAFCGGSAERSLGLLAVTASEHDAAARHFEAALAENMRIGAAPWVAHTRHDYARALLARGDRGARARAHELLRAAAAYARSAGMPQLLERAERLLADAAPAPPSEREAVLRREGEFWTIAYDGTTCRVRDGRGLRLIALLLASPGRAFSARELAAWPAPPLDPSRTEAAAREAGLHVDDDRADASGPDGRARAEYRAHLVRLREEADEAERDNDVGRAARAREAIALVTEELVAAARSATRRRTVASERARLRVTKAIRYAIGKIARVHPALAQHLTATLETGSTCRYESNPAHPIRWLL